MKGEVENDRKIFIGGLNYETTRETLLDYFSTFGQVRQLDLPLDDVHVGENKGFVLVTFETSLAAEAVLAKEKHHIDGKFLDARYARPDNSHRGFKSGSQKSRRVFVGGIRDNHNRDFLKEFFDQFGSVTDVEIFYNRMTGVCRGFAFVEFQDASTAERILQQKFFIIRGDKCEVKPAFCRENGEKNQDWNGLKRRQGGFGQTKSFSKTSSDHGYCGNTSPPPGVSEEPMNYFEGQLAPFAFYQNTPPPVQFELPPLGLSSSYFPTSPELMFYPFLAVPPPTTVRSPVIFQEFPEVVNYLPYYASF